MPARFEYAPMHRDQFRSALRGLDMDAFAFARLTGTGPRTIQRWLSGEKDIPHWVPLLIAVLGLPKALGTARMVTATMIQFDRLNPALGEFPFAHTRDIPDDGPDWLE